MASIFCSGRFEVGIDVVNDADSDDVQSRYFVSLSPAVCGSLSHVCNIQFLRRGIFTCFSSVLFPFNTNQDVGF